MAYKTVQVVTRKGKVLNVRVNVPCFFVLSGLRKPIRRVLFTSTGRQKVTRALFELTESKKYNATMLIPTSHENQIPLFYGDQEITKEKGFLFDPEHYVIYVDPKSLTGRVLYHE